MQPDAAFNDVYCFGVIKAAGADSILELRKLCLCKSFYVRIGLKKILCDYVYARVCTLCRQYRGYKKLMRLCIVKSWLGKETVFMIE